MLLPAFIFRLPFGMAAKDSMPDRQMVETPDRAIPLIKLRLELFFIFIALPLYKFTKNDIKYYQLFWHCSNDLSRFSLLLPRRLFYRSENNQKWYEKSRTVQIGYVPLWYQGKVKVKAKAYHFLPKFDNCF